VPVCNLFDETPCSDVSYEQLLQLAAEARLKYYFPYARGSAPWFRISDPNDPFYLPVGSMEVSDIEAIEAELTRLGAVKLFPGRYGEPVRIDQSG
jgi:hypothetical protein